MKINKLLIVACLIINASNLSAMTVTPEKIIQTCEPKFLESDDLEKLLGEAGKNIFSYLDEGNKPSAGMIDFIKKLPIFKKAEFIKILTQAAVAEEIFLADTLASIKNYEVKEDRSPAGLDVDEFRTKIKVTNFRKLLKDLE